MKKKIAIIGASYLQEPLIQKAKSLGYETHVFAWECGDVGEKSADVFHPISIVEKDAILKKCADIGVCGVCSIASDLASITVNYVANGLGLNGNSMECVERSTNKHAMREAFAAGGDPSPRSVLVSSAAELDAAALSYPVIVKPTDRSGSRGITKLYDPHGLEAAVNAAVEQSFEKKALVEEFAEGEEYSVECASFNGEHSLIAITKKYTTGAPHFIETGHMEPAMLTADMYDRVRRIIFHALDTLGVTDSVSHSEVKIDGDCIKIIEIGARMGGDCIGSDLVQLSTGVDLVKAAIDIAVGVRPELAITKKAVAMVRYMFDEGDVMALKNIEKTHPELLVRSYMTNVSGDVTDSSSRHGMFILSADSVSKLAEWLPKEQQ